MIWKLLGAWKEANISALLAHNRCPIDKTLSQRQAKHYVSTGLHIMVNSWAEVGGGHAGAARSTSGFAQEVSSFSGRQQPLSVRSLLCSDLPKVILPMLP